MVLEICPVLDEASSTSFLVKEYGQAFCCGGCHHLYLDLDQQAVVLRKRIGRCDIDPGIATGHTLYFGQYGRFCGFGLVFKHIAPDGGTIAGPTRQFALLDVESIGEISLDQFKIHQSEFLELIDGVESYERGHVSI